MFLKLSACITRTTTLCVLSLFAGVLGVRADSTLVLSGTLSDVSGTSVFVVGQPFTITFTLLSGIADSQPTPTQIGTYDGAITAYEFNYNNGAYVGTAGEGRLFVYDNFENNTDAVQMDFAGSPAFDPVDGYSFNLFSSGPYFFLTNNSGLQFSNDALPDPFPTSGWDTGRFTLGWGEQDHDPMPIISVSGAITSVTAVPEPASAALIVGELGVGVAACCRRRGAGGK